MQGGLRKESGISSLLVFTIVYLIIPSFQASAECNMLYLITVPLCTVLGK